MGMVGMMSLTSMSKFDVNLKIKTKPKTKIKTERGFRIC